MQSSGGVLLTGLFPWLAQPAEPKDHQPTVGWVLPYQPLIKKMPYEQISWGHFLNYSFLLSQNCSSCVKLTQDQPAQISRCQVSPEMHPPHPAKAEEILGAESKSTFSCPSCWESQAAPEVRGGWGEWEERGFWHHCLASLMFSGHDGWKVGVPLWC